MAMIFSNVKSAVTDVVKYINHLLDKAASVTTVDPAQDAALIADGKAATKKIADSIVPSVSEKAAAEQANEARTTAAASSDTSPRKP